MQCFVLLLLFCVIERLLLCRKEARSQKDKHHNSAPNKITEISLLNLPGPGPASTWWLK